MDVTLHTPRTTALLPRLIRMMRKLVKRQTTQRKNVIAARPPTYLDFFEGDGRQLGAVQVQATQTLNS